LQSGQPRRCPDRFLVARVHGARRGAGLRHLCDRRTLSPRVECGVIRLMVKTGRACLRRNGRCPGLDQGRVCGVEQPARF
jgi:hypothetical protein